MCVFIYAVISKYISKDNDNIAARRFCAAFSVSLYTNVAILPPALPRALFLYIAPLLASLAVAFGVVLRYSARNGQSAPRIGGRVALVAFPSVSAFLSLLVGQHIHPTPPPKPAREIWAAFSKNFSEKYFFIFFIFPFVFCWLFSYRTLQNRIFS